MLERLKMSTHFSNNYALNSFQVCIPFLQIQSMNYMTEIRGLIHNDPTP